MAGLAVVMSATAPCRPDPGAICYHFHPGGAAAHPASRRRRSARPRFPAGGWGGAAKGASAQWPSSGSCRTSLWPTARAHCFTCRSPACQTESARTRRCADPGGSVAAGSPKNPPVRRVYLSASRPPSATRRRPAWATRAPAGRRRAGLVVSVWDSEDSTVPFVTVVKARSVEQEGALFFPIERSCPPDSDGLGRLRLDSARDITVYRDTATQEA